MFRIDSLILGYSNNEDKTIYKFDQINYIFGKNDVGKTVMIKTIDFVLGKSNFKLDNYEGLDGIEYISTLLVNNEEKLYLKRTKDNLYYYKRTENSDYIALTYELYKQYISNFLTRNDNKYIETLSDYLEENVTIRSFACMNFMDEKSLGTISNIFSNDVEYYKEIRTKKIISFLFNYKNIKRIQELEKRNIEIEKKLKENDINISKYNYLTGNIKNSFQNLGLDIVDDLSEMEKEFILYKNNFNREKKNNNRNNDLIILMKMSCQLSEEIKYQENLEKQCELKVSRNKNSEKLMSCFKDILLKNDKYEPYIECIVETIEKQKLENDILTCKDYKKTIENIKNKKAKIDEKIAECSKDLNKLDYVEILKTIGVLEKSFVEINKLSSIKEVDELKKELRDNKNKIKDIKKEFDTSLVKEFERHLNVYYYRISNTANFAKEDYKSKNFKIKFDPNSVSLCGERLCEEKNKLVKYSPGSNARMTTWQGLVYLTMLKMIMDNYSSLPLLPMLIVDGLNQPYDEEDNYPEVCKLFIDIAKENHIQLFIISTRELDRNIEIKNIDLSSGFNKMHK